MDEPVLTPAGLGKPIDLSQLVEVVEKKKKNKFKLERPNKLTPLTPEQWEAMPPKAKWDCIVALRGPDLRYSEALKFLTSSVIRYKLSGVMRVGGLINDRLPFVVTSDYEDSESNFNYAHFNGHIHEAANWLSIPCINVSSEVMKKIMSGKVSRVYGAMEVYPFAPKEYQACIKGLFLATGYPLPQTEAPNAQG